MWADENQFIEAWEAMLSEIIKMQHRKISIFLSDSIIDSIACAKILASILNQYSIPYSFYVTTSPYDLIEQLNSDFSKKHYSVLLINCGGVLNMEKEMNNFIGDSKVRIFIIDAHRPMCHKNLLSTNKSVIVFMHYNSKRPIKYLLRNIEKLETKILFLNELINKNKIYYEKLSENKNNENVKANKKKVHRNIEKMKNKIILMNEKLRILTNEYYANGRYWGKPVSYIAIKLAISLNKARLDDIWCAIVGYTEYYINQMMSEEMYTKLTFEFESMIFMVSARAKIGKMDSNFCQNPELNSLRLSKYQSFKNIELEKNLRLPLLTWWTLYDSAINSIYICSKLQTWSESGTRAVESMLAKIGYSRRNSNRSWSDLSPDLKATLQDGIEKWASKFNIPDMKYNAFTKYYNWKKIAASDVVYALIALKACQSDDPYVFPQNSNCFEDLSSSKIIGRNLHKKCLLDIWNALDFNNETDIQHGILLAKNIQKSVLIYAGSAVTSENVKMQGKIRVYDMNLKSSSHEIVSFENSEAFIQKIGVLLRDIYKQMTGENWPILVIGPIDQKNCVKIIPIPQTILLGINWKFYSQVLQIASSITGLSTYRDNFDYFVINAKSKSLLIQFINVIKSILKKLSMQ